MDLKEKILSTKNWNSEYPNYMAECEIHEAMDELSKIAAIAFAKFINGHRLDFQTATPDGYWIGLDMKRYSTEELYDLFTQSKEYKELMDQK